MLEHVARANPDHFAYLQGVGYTMIGLGASVSNVLAAEIIDHHGFAPAYLTLAAIALVPIVLTAGLKELGTSATAGLKELGTSTNSSACDLPLDLLHRLKWTAATVCLLVASCTAMITAWYLHLKFEDVSIPTAILFSWLIAGGEYLLQVPANRIGALKAGLTPCKLRGIAELATLVAFLVFQECVLNHPVLLNHVIGFGVVFVGVIIVLAGPWTSPVCAAKVDEVNEGDAKATEITDANRGAEELCGLKAKLTR